MNAGIAGKNAFGLGGSIQFEFEDIPSEAWFTNSRKLVP